MKMLKMTGLNGLMVNEILEVKKEECGLEIKKEK